MAWRIPTCNMTPLNGERVQKKQVQEKYHAVLVVNGTTTKDVVLAILMDCLSQERVF